MRTRLLLPWRWPAWVWLSGLAAVLLIRFPIYFALSPPYLMDFEVYRAIAQRIAEGGGGALYQPTTSALMMFKYAPCWALAWLPLAWLPGHIGAVLWTALTALWLVLACWTASRLCAGATLRVPTWVSVGVVLLLVRPMTAEFLNGQVDILWALLVTASLLTMNSHQTWWSAVWLALAIALKLPALIVLAYFLLRRRWVFSLQVMAVFLAVNGLASLLLNPAQPWDLIRDWSRVLWISGGGRAFEIGNQSLAALAARFLSADGYHLNIAALSTTAIVALTLLVLGGLFSLVCVGPTSRLPEATRLVFDGALLSVLMVLGSPTTWIATYSALILPVSLAITCLLSWWRHPLLRGQVIAALLTISSLTGLSLMTHSKFWKALGILYFRGESYVFLVLMILPWFGLALFASLWYQRRIYVRTGVRD